MTRRFIAVAFLSAFVWAAPSHADSIDDAAAKTRGVPIQQIQLEKEQKKTADLEAKNAVLKADLKVIQAENEALKKQIADLTAQVNQLKVALASNAKGKPDQSVSQTTEATKKRADLYKNDPGASYKSFCQVFVETCTKKAPAVQGFSFTLNDVMVDLKKTDSLLVPFQGTLTASLKNDKGASAGKIQLLFVSDENRWSLRDISMDNGSGGSFVSEYKYAPNSVVIRFFTGVFNTVPNP